MQFQVHRAGGNASPATLIATADTFADARAAFDADADAWAIIPAGTAAELAAFGNLYSIAPRYYSGMFVTRSGGGFGTLGFEVADRKGRAVAAWAGLPFGLPAIGTPESFACYTAAMIAGAEHARKTGTRCPAELTPELIGLEGRRVEVTGPDGYRKQFNVGKSTGWMPCHLEIANARSTGGGPVYIPTGGAVRVIR